MTISRAGTVSPVGLMFILGGALALLTGCPDQERLTSHLYVQQAYHGYFVPTKDAFIYDLVISSMAPEAVWFTDRPEHDAGTESCRQLAGMIWEAVFEGQEPAGGIAYRLEDGIWELLPAQFLDVSFSLDDATMTWTVRLPGTPPRSLLTGVSVYLDDKGKDETTEADTGVYLYVAGEAIFTSTETTGRYSLALAGGPEELMLVRTPPHTGASLERADMFVEQTWPAYFADDPPNAVVTIEAPDGVQSPIVATLSEPAWDTESGTLTFTADILLGEAEITAGPATVFIDDWDDHEDDTVYKVVVNHEEQYSIWPADRENPPGWSDAGFSGTKRECLDYIKEIWIQVRPLSPGGKMGTS